ncbi:MAG TPA: HAD-IIB family hydrolase [Steroidobacteraceae bacterium]|nr:HAD-IIB family hydrolase [Steroidobacteraceae bacterium]
MAVRLVGIDVDGTLVGSSGVVDPRVWEAAAAARAQGIHLALCSGRPAFGVALDYAHQLDPNGWHAFQNGASVVDLATGQSHSAVLTSEWVITLIAQSRSTGFILELYNDNAFVCESTSPWAREHAALLGAPYEPRPLESLPGPIVRAQWLLSLEQATRLTALPHPGLEVARSTSPIMPGVQFVGLTREGANKGHAMRTIAGQYGVPMGDVMYIGDADNDLSALRVVGHPVAMENGGPAVLKAAERHVSPAEEAGVAEALEIAMG